MKNIFITLFRLVIGGIFVYASIDKIFHPAAFAEIIYNYQILPEPFINITALILPWLELFLGINIVIGFWLPGSLIIGNSLLTVFLAALVVNKIRGIDINCGCFSTGPQALDGGTMIWNILRDTVILLLGIYLFYTYTCKKSFPAQTH